MDAILTEKAEQLAKEIATQAETLDDLNSLIKLMMKSALERMLDTEMDVHLGRKKLPGLTADSAADVPASCAAGRLRRRGRRIVAMDIHTKRYKAILAKSGSRRRAIAMAPSSQN